MAGVRAVALSWGVPGPSVRPRPRRPVCALLLALSVASGCDDGRTRLVVRTDLPRELRDEVESSFEATAPEIDLRFDVDDDEATLTQLLAVRAAGAGTAGDQPEAPPFDLWWGATDVQLERAFRSGALQLVRPLTATPFVIAFDRDRLGLSDAPRDWIDLFHHGWAGEIVLPDPTRFEPAGAFVGAMVVEAIRDEGLSWVGFEWLGRLDGQIVRYVPDEREALRALRLEQASLAVVRRATVEMAAADDESLYYRIPESGAPDEVRGAGLLTGSEATDAAIRFLHHLDTPEAAGLVEAHMAWEPFDGARATGAARVQGFEAPYPLATDMVVDSLGTWLERWSREVRGRGK